MSEKTRILEALKISLSDLHKELNGKEDALKSEHGQIVAKKIGTALSIKRRQELLELYGKEEKMVSCALNTIEWCERGIDHTINDIEQNKVGECVSMMFRKMLSDIVSSVSSYSVTNGSIILTQLNSAIEEFKK